MESAAVARRLQADGDRLAGARLLKEARLRAGLTQAELAARMGTTQSAVARWESGHVAPTFHRVSLGITACGLALVPQLVPRDESEDQLIDYHLSLTPMERVQVLDELLRMRALTRQAVRSDGG